MALARTVKEKEYADRRNEILDVAQRGVYTKGYEQMTIQDILTDLQISKGAFYHYFDSKQALLEALCERMIREVEMLLIPIVHDPALPAFEKLRRFFATSVRWKTEHKAFILALLRVWYADENAIVREKVRNMTFRLVAPLLAVIIRQGMEEKVFAAGAPEYAGAVVLSLIQGLQDRLGALLLAAGPPATAVDGMVQMLLAYTDAMERVLGAPAGSIEIVAPETFTDWLL